MMPDQRRAISQIRFERADETLEEAQTLLEKNLWHGTINRIYYAMFYAVGALSNAYGFSTSKHSSLEGWFNKNIVHPGLIDKEIGQLYRQLYDLRYRGDYSDLARIDPNMVQMYIKLAKPFIETLRQLTLKKLDKS
jgi:uncharacterized protein (UPF0332 family)